MCQNQFGYAKKSVDYTASWNQSVSSISAAYGYKSVIYIAEKRPYPNKNSYFNMI